jgi:hypothetical protein
MDVSGEKPQLAREILEDAARIIEVYAQQQYDWLSNDRHNAAKLIVNSADTAQTLEEMRQQAYVDFHNRFGIEDEILELLVYVHTEYTILLSTKCDLNNDDPLQLGTDSYSYRAIRTFSWILINLTNTFISIRRCLQNGMDLQAKTLLRTYIELADIGLALLSSEDFFNRFAVGVDLEEAEHYWHLNFKPKKTRQQVQQFYLSMDPSGSLWSLVSEVRDDAYELLSAYSHGAYIASFISAYAEDSDGHTRTTFGGKVGEAMELTIKNAILYSWFFIAYSMAALVKNHHLPFMRFGDEGTDFVFTEHVVEHLIKAFAKHWVSSSDENGPSSE